MRPRRRRGERRTVLEVGGSLSRRRRARACSIARSAPRRSPTAPTSDAMRRSPRCGGCGSPARRSPRCSTCRSRRSRAILTRIGMGRLGRLGPRARAALRTRAAGRADPHRRQEARPHRRRRRQARHRRATQPAARRVTDAAGFRRNHRLGLRAHRHRRLHAPGLRRSPARREGHHRDRVPWPRHRTSSPATASPSSACSPTTARPTAHRSRIACSTLGIRHLRTRPCRPQTNGKAERFIRTMLGGWAYGAIYSSSRRTHRSP